MYEYKIQIGVSHVGRDNHLKLGSAVDLLQNASWFEMDTEDVLMECFSEHNMGMYLISRQMDIKRLPEYGEHVAIKDWICGFDKFFGYRNTVMYDKGGEICISTYSIGSFIHVIERKAVRLPLEVSDGIKQEPPFDMERLPRKIAVPKEGGNPEEGMLVMSCHLDNYGHMNNARYMDLAASYLHNERAVKRVRVEHKLAAAEGDYIIPYIYKTADKKTVITLCGKEDHCYAVFEIEY